MRTKKRFSREAELMQAALTEFCRASYKAASLNAILEEARISKGVFYHHFADKQALYLFVLEHAFNAKWVYIRQRAEKDREIFAHGDIFAKFRLQAAYATEFAVLHPQYQALSRMLLREQDSQILCAVRQRFGTDTAGLLAEMVDEALARNEMRGGFPRAFLVRVLNYLFSGFEEVFAAEHEPQQQRLLADLDLYVDMLQNGLGIQNAKKESS